MTDTPKGIKVEALKAHTYNGKSYQVGDTYDFYPINESSGISAEDQVASLQNTGFAARVDRADVAKAQVKATEKAAKQRASGTAVEPMTTENTGAAAPVRASKAAKTPRAKTARVPKAKK